MFKLELFVCINVDLALITYKGWLPLFSCPLWSGLVVPVKVPSTGQVELFNYLLMIIIISFFETIIQCENYSYFIGILDISVRILKIILPCAKNDEY